MPKSTCSACGRTFCSVTAFDAHRVGRYMPNERRCLTDAELLERGWRFNERRQCWTNRPLPSTEALNRFG